MTVFSKPILGISMGDPAGVGPEIICRALSRPRVRELCRPIVVGDACVLRNAAKYARVEADIRPVNKVADAKFQPNVIDVLDLKNVDIEKLQLGQVSAMAGHAAFEAVRVMID